MAIDYNGALLLADAVKRGMEFGNTVTIGHLDLVISPAQPGDVLELAGLKNRKVQGLAPENPAFADDFLLQLGASKVTPLDASPYEGATLVHDLNTPLPENLRGQFDTVIDGGSLEHIFNAPMALKGFMELLKPGGHLIIHTPANNAFGHGLYQFSPEFFFRSLARENGFEVMWMIVHEMSRGSRMYQVLDPDAVGWRADLVTHLPTYLFVVARKIASAPVFQKWPQQADYQQRWDRHKTAPEPKQASPARSTGSFSKNLAARLPSLAQQLLHRFVAVKWLWRRTLDTGRCFRRWTLFSNS